MKKFAVLVSLFLITFNVTAAPKTKIKNVTYDEEKDTYTCNFKDMTRKFIISVPTECNENTSLIIMLHGLGMSAASFKEEIKLEEAAIPRNYAVLYIDGSVDTEHRSYGSGWHFYDDKYSKKDEEFVIELGKYCKLVYGLGPKMFVGGFSNGAFMTNKLLSVHSENFTAGVSVSGTMMKNAWAQKTNLPVGYLQINGTKDDAVPMEFMETSASSPNPSMEKVIKYYVEVNKIPYEYETIKISEAAKMYNYSSKVAWVIIEEGRHNWPNLEFSKFNASEVILDFFDNF